MQTLFGITQKVFTGLYESSGVEILTQDEYISKICDSIQTLSNLNKKNVLSHESYRFIVGVLASKVVELRVSDAFSIGNDPTALWMMPKTGTPWTIGANDISVEW